jgi:hypothetical protein
LINKSYKPRLTNNDGNIRSCSADVTNSVPKAKCHRRYAYGKEGGWKHVGASHLRPEADGSWIRRIESITCKQESTKNLGRRLPSYSRDLGRRCCDVWRRYDKGRFRIDDEANCLSWLGFEYCYRIIRHNSSLAGELENVRAIHAFVE